MSLNRFISLISINYSRETFIKSLCFLLFVSFFCFRTDCFANDPDLGNDAEEIKRGKATQSSERKAQQSIKTFFSALPSGSPASVQPERKRKASGGEHNVPEAQEISGQSQKKAKSISVPPSKGKSVFPENSLLQTPSLKEPAPQVCLPKKGTKRKAAEELQREDEKKPKSGKKINLNVYFLKKIERKEGAAEQQAEDERLSHLSDVLSYIPETKHSLINILSGENDHFITFQKMMGINEDEEIYIFEEIGLRELDWVKSINAEVNLHKKKEVTRNSFYYDANRHKEVKGGVIIIKKVISDQETFFALTFGVTGRFLLSFDLCDTTFAKHHAYNLLSSNTNYRAKAFSEIDLDEQKLKSEEAKYHGKVEVVRGIRAFVPTGLKVTDGKRGIGSFLGIHLCMNDDLKFATIGDKCQSFLEISKRLDYQTKYSEIDYFTPLEDEDLIKTIFDKAHEHMFIEFPFEINGGISPDDFCQFDVKTPSGPLFSDHFDKTYDEFSEFAEDLKRFCGAQRKDILEKLRKIKITGKDSSQRLGTWRADQLISAEVDHDDKTYWIEGKDVFEVSKSYVDMINKRLDDAFFCSGVSGSPSLDASSSLRLLEPFSEQDKKENKRSKEDGTVIEEDRYDENVYNARIAGKYPENFILFDCENIKIGEDSNGRSQVEPADLLSLEGDFIHIKRYVGSSDAIYYVNTQGLNSAKLFLTNKKYRAEILKKVGERESFKDIKKSLERKEFQVVFGLIHSNQNFTPSRLAINAKLDLYRSFQELDRLGIKGKIIAIKDETPSSKKKPKEIKDKKKSSFSKTKRNPNKKQKAPSKMKAKKKQAYPSISASLSDDLASQEENVSSSPVVMTASIDMDESDQGIGQENTQSRNQEYTEPDIQEDSEDIALSPISTPPMDNENSEQDVTSQLMNHEYVNLDIQNAIEASMGSYRDSQDFSSFEMHGGYKFFKLNKRIITPAITYKDEPTPTGSALKILKDLFTPSFETSAEILMPFNPGSHWVVLRIIVQRNGIKIHYIDSLKSEDLDIESSKTEHILQEIMEPLKAFLEEYLSQEVEINIKSFRIQTDKKACGAMTVANILDLFNGNEPDSDILDREQTQSLREHQRDIMKDSGFTLDYEGSSDSEEK